MVNVALNTATETDTAQPVTVANSFITLGTALESDDAMPGYFQKQQPRQPLHTQGGEGYGTDIINLTVYPHQARGVAGRYAQAVLEDGAEAYWRFDEVRVEDSFWGTYDYGGPVYDSTGHGHNADPAGLSIGDRGVRGLLGGDPSTAFYCSGLGGGYQVITIPHGAWMESLDFTIEGLLKTGSKGKVIWARAISSRTVWELGTDALTGALYFSLGRSSSGVVKIIGTTDVTHLTGGLPSDDYHFAVRRHGDTFELLVNGEVEATGTADGNPNPLLQAIPMTFGNRYAGANSSLQMFNAVFDEWAFYPFSLDDEAIANHVELWSTGQSVDLGTAWETDGDMERIVRGPLADNAYDQNFKVTLNDQLMRPHYGGQLRYVDVIKRSEPWAFWDWHNRAGFSIADTLADPEEERAQSGGTPDPYRVTTLPDYAERHRAHLATLAQDEDGVRYAGQSQFSAGEDMLLGQLYPVTHYEPVDPADTDFDAPLQLLNESQDWYLDRYYLAPGSFVQSDDLFDSSEVTVELWLMLNAALTGTNPVPLIGFATAAGASSLDKCLYLGSDGKLRWLTGEGGGREIIVAPSALPVNKRLAHIVASIGPDGTKIRVDGQTVISGVNTVGSSTPMYAFVLSGGNEPGLAFTAHTSDSTNNWKPWIYAPAIYDNQLSDDETDLHLRAGRSYPWLLTRWGRSATNPWIQPNTFGKGHWWTSITQRGGTFLRGPEGLIPNEPFGPSSAIESATPLGIEFDSGGKDIYTKFACAMVVQPDGLDPTDTMVLATNGTYLTVAGYGLDSWTWRIRNERLEFIYRYGSRSNAWPAFPDAPTQVFTHSKPILDGETHMVGIWLDGTSVKLFVDTEEEDFTRTGGAYYKEGGSGDSWYLRLFDGIGPGQPFIGNFSHLFWSYPRTGGTDSTGNAVTTETYNNIPPTLFADLGEAFTFQLVDVGTAETVEEALPILPFRSIEDLGTAEEINEAPTIPGLFPQDIDLEVAEELDEAPGLEQRATLGTAEETDQALVLAPPAPPVEVTLQFGSAGLLGFESDLIVMNPLINVSVLEDAVDRAPSTITVAVSGGEPLAAWTLTIDGTTVLTGEFNSEGGTGLLSVPVMPAYGLSGSHTVEVSQVALTGDTVTGSDTFIVVRDPAAYPTGPAEDEPPVPVAGAVQRWVFQDPLPSGIGSWVMPANPRTMTSPHFEKALRGRHTTAPRSGQYHVTEGGQVVKQWQFGGQTWDPEVVAKLKEYFALQRRIYIIDHRSRAWKVALEDLQLTPHLQQNFDGEQTDWGHDWQVTCTILDQNWTDV